MAGTQREVAKDRASTGPARNSMPDIDDFNVVSDVEHYSARLRQGYLPDREAILDRFPHLADKLSGCLDALELLYRAKPDFRCR